ncbi:hypothetical protein GCM10010191_78920 [Actinomadura vinacea]|uniref:Toxin-antitoxin system HicB family antitoxin n=1 Tax=Actinomadura vinacea TaxID=115336 RepID=A0ABN3K4U3_9ACTN
MDLTPYVDHLRRELEIAAATGGQDVRDLAGRLTAPLESAARLALLKALSDATDEITRELAPGSVEVRLRGLDPGFVVTPPPGGPPAGDADAAAPAPAAADAPPRPAPPPAPEADDGGTSRITLRVPDHLKPRIEEAAARDGLSVNAWLVRAVTAAVEPAGRDRGRQASGHTRGPGYGQRYTGWVR